MLATRYKYRKLNKKLSSEVRQKYLDNIPLELNIEGDINFKIYTLSNILISNGYNRIVIGDYGAFIEFDKSQIVRENIKIKQGQEYRINDPKYSDNVKYFWLTAKDDSDIKIYYQKKTVTYADLINWTKEEYKRGYSKKESLLGSIQFVNCSDGKIIANLFGQEGYGRDKQYTDYDALRKSLEGLYESVTWSNNILKGKTIAIPYNLGCGLAGGDWNIVYEMIKQVFYNYEVTIYKLS